jgi:hypothetical protein
MPHPPSPTGDFLKEHYTQFPYPTQKAPPKQPYFVFWTNLPVSPRKIAGVPRQIRSPTRSVAAILSTGNFQIPERIRCPHLQDNASQSRARVRIALAQK